ncbi:hypothetical protein [Bacillus clarus]
MKADGKIILSPGGIKFLVRELKQYCVK